MKVTPSYAKTLGSSDVFVSVYNIKNVLWWRQYLFVTEDATFIKLHVCKLFPYIPQFFKNVSQYHLQLWLRGLMNLGVFHFLVSSRHGISSARNGRRYSFAIFWYFRSDFFTHVMYMQILKSYMFWLNAQYQPSWPWIFFCHSIATFFFHLKWKHQLLKVFLTKNCVRQSEET